MAAPTDLASPTPTRWSGWVRFLGLGAVLFGACLMGGLGLLFALDPDRVRDAAGILPDSPAALTEIRSTYGGLHIGIGVFLLLAAVSETRRRAALLFCSLAFAGAGAARVAGILEFQAAESAQVVTAALELAFSAITLALYGLWPQARSERPA